VGLKRAPNKADPAVIAAAREMRKAGASMREIAQAVGLARSTLGNYFDGDPELQGALGEAEASGDSIDEADFVGRVEDASDATLTVLRGIIQDFAKRLSGKKGAKSVGAKELAECRKTIIELRKLVALTKGKPTTITQQIKSKGPTVGGAEPPRTDAEARLIAGLRAAGRLPPKAEAAN
jgi:predicted transcriptional regulator